MVRKDMVIMSQKELSRLHIVRKVLDKEIKQTDAAEIIGLSDRQIRRIIKNVRKRGDTGIAHASRGKASGRAIAKEIKEKAIELYRQKYWDFGPTLASEKLFEIDKIKLSDETLRIWLLQSGDWKKQRKSRKHRKRRERKHHLGEMTQMDGSEHDWFEGRGPKCVLMGYIDDATSNVFAKFYEYEGTLPAMDSLKRYIKKYGLPQLIYYDRHGAYQSKAKLSIEDELNNVKHLTQLQRALDELGVKDKHALSPQAKGRIERLFRTFQDRLIKEMRLEQVSSIKEANKFLESYLPKYNKRFRVEPIEDGDYHRPVPADIDLDEILCKRDRHPLRNDFTVVHEKKLYQVKERVDAKKVFVEERTNGRMYITHKGRKLKYEQIQQGPKKTEPSPIKVRKTAKKAVSTIPADNHPWKKWIERGYPQNSSYQQRKKKEAKKKEKLLLLVH